MQLYNGLSYISCFQLACSELDWTNRPVVFQWVRIKWTQSQLIQYCWTVQQYPRDTLYWRFRRINGVSKEHSQDGFVSNHFQYLWPTNQTKLSVAVSCSFWILLYSTRRLWWSEATPSRFMFCFCIVKMKIGLILLTAWHLVEHWSYVLHHDEKGLVWCMW